MSLPTDRGDREFQKFRATPSGPAVAVKDDLGSTEATLLAFSAKLNPLTAPPTRAASGLVTRPLPFDPPTFSISAYAVAIGSGKSMLSIQNIAGSAVKLKILELYITNVQLATINGVVAEFGLRRASGHSAGVDITTAPASAGGIFPHDTADALSASITVKTGATISGETAFDFRRWLWLSDEYPSATGSVMSNEHTSQQASPAMSVPAIGKAFTLNAGETMTIKQNTASTAGMFDLFAVVVVEA